MSDWISRPPFDEQGRAGGVIPEQKKKRRRWLLPAALCAAVPAVIAAYRHFSRTPQELCTYAMMNAFSYGVGYDTPVGDAMDLRGLAERLQTGRFQLNWDLQLEGTNIEWSETPLAKLEGADELPDPALLNGLGIRAETGVFLDEAVKQRLYVSYGAIRFPLLELYASKERLALSSPELSDAVVSAAPDALFGDWERLPQWAWMEEPLRETVQDGIGLAERGIGYLQERLKTGKQVFHTFYDTTGEFLEELLSSFSYETLDKKDAEAERRLYVGGEKQLCQGYTMVVDGARLTESFAQAFGLPADGFRLEGEDGAEIVFRLYLTKKAELASLCGACRLWVGDTCWPVRVTAEFSGKEHSADSFLLTAAVGEKEEVLFTLEKKAERDGDRVTADIGAGLKLWETVWTVTGGYALSGGSRLEAEFALQENGAAKGSLSFTAVFAPEEDAWKASLRKLKVTDSEGNYLSVNTALEALPLPEAPKPPEGAVYELFSMTADEWERIKKELSESVQKYLELFDKLF